MKPDKLPVLALEKVSKSFGATRALDTVDLALFPGEVHALAGANGAGKSTLIRILSGAIVHYEGSLRVAGVERRFAGPTDAIAAGIATIHQELSLVGSMSVADNLLLGRPGLWAQRDDARVEAALTSMGLDVSPNVLVETLPLVTRQLVEIARALALDARVVVMDEPTSALSDTEAEQLFERILLDHQGSGVNLGLNRG